MKEKFEFIGRKYSNKEKQSLHQQLQTWSREALVPVEGELEKTQEEIKIIEVINSLLADELKYLGIKQYKPILPAQVHILPGNIFDERFPEIKGNKGFFLSNDDVIYINKDKVDTKVRMLSILLHEVIHRTSRKKFYADQEQESSIYSARTGYRLRSPWKKQEREKRLRGFNEIVTDYTVWKIFSKNSARLESELGIAKEDLQGPIYTYMKDMPILETIIMKIAADKNISPSEVSDNFERGQFQPNLLVLKDVDRSFGRGTLKLLSCLGVLEPKSANDELTAFLKKLLLEPDKSKREEILGSISIREVL